MFSFLALIESFNLHNWLEELSGKIAAIDQRCQTLSECMNDLIITIRLLRPSDSAEVTCLQDVIDYHTLQRDRGNSREEVRMDLLREYIAIANQIRLEVESIDSKDLHICFDESLSPGNLDLFHKLLNTMYNMLDTGYKFESDDTRTTSKQTTTGLEKEMFFGLQSYLPGLIKQLYGLVDALRHKPEVKKELDAEIDKSDLHNEEHHEENKENIINQEVKKSHQNCRICAEKSLAHRSEKPLNQSTSVHYIETWTPS